jgi:membrane-associated phospholipid phosphatase
MTRVGAAARPRDPLDDFGLGFGLAYAVLIGVASGRAITGLELLLVNLGAGLTALALLPRLRAGRSLGRFCGIALSLLLFYLYYLETRLVLNGAAVSWRDAVVARVELPWWRAMTATPQSAVLGEFFAFGYVVYVPMLLGVAAALLAVPGRGPRAPAESLVRRVCLAWALCFVVFVLVPVLGPRFLFPSVQAARLAAGPFSFLARLNQYGQLHGGSFPSAHVAATAVTVWSTWRWRRALLWIVLPLSVLLAASCVYLLYHYVIDVLVGVLFGGAAVMGDHFVLAAAHRKRAA